MVNTQHSGFGKYPLRHVALGLLMPGPKHGYGLFQDFETLFGSIWKAGQTKFYVLLNTLQDEGYLTATEEPQKGRPNRKVYHLTEAGRAIFMEWVYQPVASLRAIRVEFIAKLRFFDILDLPERQTLIDRQAATVNTMITEWEAAPQPEDAFLAIVDDYRIRQAKAVIDWLHAAHSYMEGYA